MNRLIISLILLAPALASLASAQDYVVTPLTLGGPSSFSQGINNAGYVTGSADTANGVRDAFLWKDGTMTGLGPGEAFAANASGEAVGAGKGGAVLWKNGVAYSIGPPGGTAYGINNAGTIVGLTVVPSSFGGTAHPFVDNNGAFTVLEFIDAPRDRDRRVSTQAFGMPLGSFLEIYATAQPRPFAILRLDAAHGLAFDIEGTHLRGAQLIHPTSMPGVQSSRKPEFLASLHEYSQGKATSCAPQPPLASVGQPCGRTRRGAHRPCSAG